MPRIKLVSANILNYFETNKIEKGTAVPTTGAHTKGDLVINIGADANTRPMWVCTETGTPGKWAPVNTGSTYTHPASHPASMITQDSSHRFVTDAEKTKWDGKASTDVATTSVNGLMSKEDKIKVDSIGNKSQLQTVNKNDLVSAINEVFQNANNGKDIIANAIGSPLVNSDTFSDMGDKIFIINEKFKNKLNVKGVNVSNINNYNGLVDKIDEINIEKHSFPKWHPSGDVWIKGSPMITSRYFMTSSVVGDNIFVIGGLDKSTALTKNQMYNTINNEWSNKADIPVKCCNLASSAVGDIIYAFGGAIGTGTYDSTYNMVEAYNTVNDTWETKANMPTARHSLSACAVGKNIYVFGGYKTTSSSKVNEVYDTLTDTWASKNDMLAGNYSFTTSVVGTKIYLIGGSSSTRNEVYDILTNTWTAKANMSVYRRMLASSSVGENIYVFGGMSQSASNRVDVYNTITDTWETKSNMLNARYGLVANNVSDAIYVIGGYISGITGVNEVYIP